MILWVTLKLGSLWMRSVTLRCSRLDLHLWLYLLPLMRITQTCTGTIKLWLPSSNSCRQRSVDMLSLNVKSVCLTTLVLEIKLLCCLTKYISIVLEISSNRLVRTLNFTKSCLRSWTSVRSVLWALRKLFKRNIWQSKGRLRKPVNFQKKSMNFTMPVIQTWSLWISFNSRSLLPSWTNPLLLSLRSLFGCHTPWRLN
jgi:hypothetical protein